MRNVLRMVKLLVMMRTMEERHVTLKVSKVDITYVHGQSPGHSESHVKIARAKCHTQRKLEQNVIGEKSGLKGELGS